MKTLLKFLKSICANRWIVVFSYCFVVNVAFSQTCAKFAGAVLAKCNMSSCLIVQSWNIEDRTRSKYEGGLSFSHTCHHVLVDYKVNDFEKHAINQYQLQNKLSGYLLFQFMMNDHLCEKNKLSTYMNDASSGCFRGVERIDASSDGDAIVRSKKYLGKKFLDLEL